nr:MAG TPA: hypothetical protein [Caudoviricetes sp.]
MKILNWTKNVQLELRRSVREEQHSLQNRVI